MGRRFSTPNPLPSSEDLHMMLRYEAETGKLFWRERDQSTFIDNGFRSADYICRMWNSKFAGKEAGSANQGYLRCMISGFPYLVHRVIWKMVNGNDPIQIDHIDGNKTNNRIENLRDVTHQVNAKNRKLYENNKTGVPGVSFHKRDKVWQVRIGVGEGNELNLGSVKTWEEAIAVRIAAETILDYHQNHGKRN